MVHLCNSIWHSLARENWWSVRATTDCDEIDARILNRVVIGREWWLNLGVSTMIASFEFFSSRLPSSGWVFFASTVVKNSWRDLPISSSLTIDLNRFSLPAATRVSALFRPSRCLNNRDELFHRWKSCEYTSSVYWLGDLSNDFAGEENWGLPIESRFRWEEGERERENRFLSFYLANPPLRETEGPANHPRYRGPVVQKPEIARFRIP